jgi:hypothetical protein
VPTAGVARYTGLVQGWYGANATSEPAYFRGTLAISADFATRQVTIIIQNTATYDSAGSSVPASFSATVPIGETGTNVAGYFTGTAASSTLSGGVSGRWFGPVSSGTAGPSEVSGVFSLNNGNASVIAGFMGRLQ